MGILEIHLQIRVLKVASKGTLEEMHPLKVVVQEGALHLLRFSLPKLGKNVLIFRDSVRQILKPHTAS